MGEEPPVLREQPLCSPGAAIIGERGLVATGLRERGLSTMSNGERGVDSDSEEGDDGCAHVQVFHDSFCKFSPPSVIVFFPLFFFSFFFCSFSVVPCACCERRHL